MRVLLSQTNLFSKTLTGLSDTTDFGLDVALGLAGVMIFWPGLSRTREQAGVIEPIARATAPPF